MDKKIRVSVPAKVILFGEHFVMYGKRARGKIRLFRVLIIIVLPIIISLCLFNPIEKIPLEHTFEENSIYISVPDEYLHNSDWKDSIRNVYGVPFDLKRYNLYFEKGGVFVTYPDGKVLEVEDDSSYQIVLNNETINISEGKIPYGPIELGKRYEYFMNTPPSWTFLVKYVLGPPPEFEEKNITVHRSFKVYARPLLSDIIVKIILFVISWMSICWLSTRIYALVYEK